MKKKQDNVTNDNELALGILSACRKAGATDLDLERLMNNLFLIEKVIETTKNELQIFEFHVFVDRNLPMSKLVGEGDYAYVSNGVNERVFCKKIMHLEKKFLFWIFKYNRRGMSIRSEEVFFDIRHFGCRPAHIKDLLAFAVPYAHPQMKVTPLVALGSSSFDNKGKVVIPVLNRRSKFELECTFWSNVWPEDTCFAAVKL